jgi:xylan 1,4-beta-xylosidase
MLSEPVYEVVEYDGHSPFKAFITGIRTINPHVHEDLEIGYVVSGIGRLRLGRSEITLKSEDVYVVNANTVHSIESQSATPLVFLFLQVRPALLEMLGIPVRTIEFRCTPALAESRAGAHALLKLRSYCASLVKLVTSGDGVGEHLVAAHVLSVLSLLLRRFPRTRRKDPQQAERTRYYDRIIRIIRYLNDNHAEEISLKKVAEEMSMSVYHLCHIFKKTAGVSVGRYLTNVRLEKVKEQLLSQDESVTNIAMNCGFNNLGYFYKAFHATMGCTPLQYKTQNAQGSLPRKQQGTGTLDAFHSAAIGNYLQVDREVFDTPSPAAETADADRERGERHRQRIVGITADMQGPVENLRFPTLSVVTLRGPLEDGPDDWAARLADLRRTVGFTHVRFDLPAGEGALRGAALRALVDAIQALPALPYIRLCAPASRARASKASTGSPGIGTGSERPPWAELAASRARRDVARGWTWEIAASPLGTPEVALKSDDYLAFYARTAHALQKAFPGARIGGTVPVIFQDREQPRLRSFLYYCVVEKVPLDFVTLQVTARTRCESGDTLSSLGLGEGGALMETLKAVRAIVEKTVHHDVDLHVDLLPLCAGLSLPAHEVASLTSLTIETSLAATGLAATLSLLSCVGTHPAGDAFVRPTEQLSDLVDAHGGYLPAYHAWWFLGRSGGASLRRGPEYIVARKDRDRVQVLLWNSPTHRLSAPGGAARADGPQSGETYFNVEINGLTGLYKGMEYTFDRRHGSIADKWLEMGSPSTCNTDEIEALCEGSRVRRTIYPVQYKGRFSRLLTLRPHGVKLIELYPSEAGP